jgi:4-methyl-5(b-hydroxyethyl)-thiazole monophosphate biosynthesis
MKTVLVLFAEGSEELEAITIVNILRRGHVQVTLAGLQPGVLRGSRGTAIQPDCTLDDALSAQYDMIVLPGGQPGTRNLRGDARVIQLVQDMAQHGKFVTAICAAPAVLAAAGLLDGKRATCYPTCLDEFANVKLKTSAIEQDGHIITSRGPGTAMDFALTLLEQLHGAAVRAEVETGLVR